MSVVGVSQPGELTADHAESLVRKPPGTENRRVYWSALLEVDEFGAAGEGGFGGGRREIWRSWGPLVSGSGPPVIQSTQLRMTMTSRLGRSEPPSMGTSWSSP